MTLDVMPRAPFRATRYTGDNAQEIASLYPGAFSAGPPVRGMGSAVTNLYKDDGQTVECGTWIIEVWGCDEQAVFLMVTDEYFRDSFAPLPLVIKDAELSEEHKAALGKWNAQKTSSDNLWQFHLSAPHRTTLTAGQ